MRFAWQRGKDEDHPVVVNLHVDGALEHTLDGLVLLQVGVCHGLEGLHDNRVKLALCLEHAASAMPNRAEQ
jgi:hypothetical protein